MKPDWEEKFNKMWFARPHETTMMNWDSMFDCGGMFCRSNVKYVQPLKENLGAMIKDFIRSNLVK